MVLSLLFLGGGASAADVWKHGMPIQNVQTLWDGGFIVYGPSGADAVCSEGRLFYARANQNTLVEAGVKVNLAVVLTAFAMGKTITFAYDNSTPACFIRTVMVNQ